MAGLGGLDILVNNAGCQQALASVRDITTEQLDATFKTNAYALVWIIQAALPHLPAGATIVNTASINAYDPGEDIIDYAATKAAIASLTKSLSKQLTPKGIRINAVAPGPCWTPLQVSGGQASDKLPKFGADSLTGRRGQPAEIAPIYVLLASTESGFTSGDILAAPAASRGPDVGCRGSTKRANSGNARSDGRLRSSQTPATRTIEG